MSEKYFTFKSYLEQKWGKKVYRLGVDAGFSCPHRYDDGSGGCIFCHENGARNLYIKQLESVREQIEHGLVFLQGRYKAEGFYLYFQANTSTNMELSSLRMIYDAALDLHPFLGLIVSTRPDCLDEEKIRWLSEYKNRGLDVWVELGLQSCSDKSLQWLNRGHTVADFEQCRVLLEAYDLPCAVHLIFGLPGEYLDYIHELAAYLNKLKINGVKIHNLNVVRGTVLSDIYLKGEFSVPNGEKHLEYCIQFLERLNPDVVVMRLNTDIPGDIRIAPAAFWPKGQFYDKLREEFVRRNTWQGRLFNEAEDGNGN